MPAHDILLGQTGDGSFVRFAGSEHIALHSRSGGGKTSSFTIPNCFAWKGSLVVLDIKGECFTATAGHRLEMGQEVYLFDPVAKDGRSHCWDPLAAVNRTSIDRFDQISRTAFSLFPENHAAGSSSNADQFWNPAGRQAFAAAATLLAETPAEPLTMGAILRLFTGRHDWLARQIALRRVAGEPYSLPVVEGLSDYLNGDANLVEGIRKTVSTRLSPWVNPRIAAATAASDFDLRDLRRRPMTIYVRVSPGSMPRLRPLLRLFFEQMVNLNTDETPEENPDLRQPVLLLLDEFVRLGRMDDLAEAAQFMRGYGLRMAFIVQNKAQVRAKYGPDGVADIFDNVGAEIIFGTADPELTQELEKRLGDNTVMFTTYSRPRFWSWFNLSRQGQSDHPHRRPLMLDQEVARMSPDEQLIIRPGMRPMKTGRIRWWDNPAFTSRVRPAPVIPRLELAIGFDDGSTPVLRQRQAVPAGGAQLPAE